MVGSLSIFPDIRRGGRFYNGQPYGCNVYLKMAIGKMFGLTGGIFLIAILLHVVPATTEMEYFPGNCREIRTIVLIASNLQNEYLALNLYTIATTKLY